MLTAGTLAPAIGATLEGDAQAPLSGFGTLETAGPSDLAFIVSSELAQRALACAAAVVIAPPGAALPGKTVLRTPWPKVAFVKAVNLMVPPKRPAPGIHPTAVIAEDAKLGAEVHVGPWAVIGSGAVLDDRVACGAGVFVGENVRIGAGTVLHPHAVIHDGVVIGERCLVRAAAVLGSQGFGFVQEGDDPAAAGDEPANWRRYLQAEKPHVKVPQLGTTILGDDVEIGAGTAVDRGTIAPTRIGSGTKIDNQVQVAHNVEIGEHCLIAAHAGISGSTRIGHHVTIGGAAGIGEGVQIGDRALVAAFSAVPQGKKIPAGEGAVGVPARVGRRAIEIVTAQAMLPRLLQQVRELRRRVAALERDEAESD
jgi:UDP-3-O-[3-hydroxymyristoyl] glucosamine N-acyltransferase